MGSNRVTGFFKRLAFHRSGKPRGWLRRVLAGRNKEIRPLFWRVVYKKNGAIRQGFQGWIRSNAGGKIIDFSPVLLRDEDPRARALRIQAVLYGPARLEEMAANYERKSGPPVLQTSDQIAGSLAARRLAHDRPLVVSVGHDNYLAVTGGVQMCIEREQQRAASYGHDYLNLHPWQPLPRLSHVGEDPDPAVVMVLNGEPLGVSRMSVLTGVLRAESAKSGPIRLVLHQLLGHQPEQVIAMAEAAGGGECFFWLHDFFSICPSYNLQRNERAFCGAPDAGSNACMVCLFGAERQAHAPRIRELFGRLKVHVVSPSQTTLEFWQRRSGLVPATARVAPHVELEWAERAGAVNANLDASVTVAFLGLPIPHKGGPVFERLADIFAHDPRYRFTVLGRRRLPNKAIGYVDVRTTAGQETAMSDAVAAENVDLVLHWASWPETFSLTTYEAIAGGAFILTNPISGNVAATVERTGFGKILADEAALVAFFESGEAMALANSARRHRAEFTATRTTSDMTLPLVTAES